MTSKKSPAVAPVMERQELFQRHFIERKHMLDLALCVFPDLKGVYLKLFHCVWEWHVCFCWAVKSNAALPFVRLVHDSSFSRTVSVQMEMRPKKHLKKINK